jgi:hypothetical protein
MSTILGGATDCSVGPGKREYLRDFVVAYLDDILIYSKTAADHLRHLRTVLERLRQHRFYAKLKKCEFNKPAVKFLGHIVSAHGVQPDPQKIKSVLSWPVPTDVTALRSFLGLANYFRKFVLRYSHMVSPLTDILKLKHFPDVLPLEALQAIERVKTALTSAPCLALPDYSKPFEVVCDASIKGIGAILLQDGRPVAYESRKLTPAEQRWHTTEQELLAVVHAFKVWRCYLEGAVGVTVVTDHCPNTFFSTQPMLSRRQARWSEYLHQFNFGWLYRPGRINAADPLSRHPEFSVAAITLAALSSAGRADRMLLPDAALSDIEQRILQAYATDPWFSDTHNLADLTGNKAGYWLREGRIVVPATDKLRYECIQLCHDMPWVGHLGQTRTPKLLKRYFWWPAMRTDVEAYVRTCDSCQRVKSANRAPAGLLQPLPVPERPWQSISMDFITCLPVTPRGHDTILVVVDRLTKLSHFLPMRETTDAAGVAALLREQVFRLHGLPENIVSDRDTRFTSEFFKALCAALGVGQHMSTAYHPETDGQTERVNRTLEDMLRHYVSPELTDWDSLLCMAEFAYNSAWHESVQNTPFFLTYGFHPHSPLDRLLHKFDSTDGHIMAVAAVASGKPQVKRQVLASLMQQVPGVQQFMQVMATAAQTSPKRKQASVLRRVPATAQFTAHMQAALQRAKSALHAANQRYKRHADKHRTAVAIAVGDRVMLNSKNVTFRSGGSRKLLPRWLGPFTVTQQINPVAFKLDLQELNGKLHPVFHSSLLRPYYTDGRTVVHPKPLQIDGDVLYEVDCIIRRYYNKAGQSFFVVRWKGYGPESDTREPAKHFSTCPEVLREFLDAEKQGLAPPPEYAKGSRALTRRPPPPAKPSVGKPSVGMAPSVAAPEPSPAPEPHSTAALVRYPPPPPVPPIPVRTRTGRSVRAPERYGLP